MLRKREITLSGSNKDVKGKAAPTSIKYGTERRVYTRKNRTREIRSPSHAPLLQVSTIHTSSNTNPAT